MFTNVIINIQTFLCVYVSVYLSVSLSLSLYLSLFFSYCTFVCHNVCVSNCITICLSHCLSVYLSVSCCLSVRQTVPLSFLSLTLYLFTYFTGITPFICHALPQSNIPFLPVTPKHRLYFTLSSLNKITSNSNYALWTFPNFDLEEFYKLR